MLGIDVEVLNAAVDNVSTARWRAIISRDRIASNRAFRLGKELTRQVC